ncbi:DUF4136 domain-containing protein [Planctomycetota bacterium]
MRHLSTVTLLAFVVFAGCTTVPVKDIEVYGEADPKAKFGGYKTYGWLATAAILNDSYGQWEPPAFDADLEIKYLIDRELRKRKMSETSYQPDIVVGFVAGLDLDVLELKLDPQLKLDILESVPQGGLIVTLADSQTGYVIWAGAAHANIQIEPDTKMAKARLDYAITQMFKEMPK